MKSRIIYYNDELNDDFAGTKTKNAKTPYNYKYLHSNPFWRIAEFVLYHLIARPFAYLASKLRYGLKIKGRKKLKAAKGKGIFMYGNHVLFSGDAFHPNLAAFPRRAYVIVGADAVSIRGLRNTVAMLGGLPLPGGKHNYGNFLKAVRHHIARKKAIMVYPEAHIWPYYNGIRPFSDASFIYPVTMNAPAYAVTTVFKKRKFRKLPKVTLYIDGPFYADKNLSLSENRAKLRNEVFAAMKERSKNSEVTLFEYVKRESDGNISLQSEIVADCVSQSDLI